MISRRHFLMAGGAAAVAAAIAPLACRAKTKATVWVVRPRSGVKYAKADLSHFANKIYPARSAAFRRMPHRGLRFEVVQREVLLPAGVTKEKLFAGRKDLDIRVATDQNHLRRLGIDFLTEAKGVFPV